ncbi:hypothetical protein SAMN04487867_10467 [Vreelandella titanicae]|uniref:phage adaptor protein n=1 Tax=Vreelandella titanicae TaxID=664683 RepID=UPI000883737E|nr:DUF6682 family protein [Halomonas titanicae]SDI27950.1 hypothetical protein SAMN04487867_10467 [Halomonas titanicae]
MAVTTVGTVIRNAKLVLQEVTAAGTRWTNEELIGWLNEFYQAAVQLKPDAHSMNAEMTLSVGTRQQIPSDGLRLIDVVRNTVGGQMAVMVTSRRALDSTRRSWHSDTAAQQIEQYMFDDLDPTHFYVYPPAANGAKLEIIYSAVPTPHNASSGLNAIQNEAFKLNDAYVPVATDYILYRAYSKDAEHAANLNRAQMHMQAYMGALGQKVQTDQRISPNTPDSSSNPPRTRQ